MANPVTPSPTALTVPASSAPGENGSGGLNWYLSSMISVSKKFSAAAATETTTCPGPATGASTSSTTSVSGGPNLSHNTALTIGAPTCSRTDLPSSTNCRLHQSLAALGVRH